MERIEELLLYYTHIHLDGISEQKERLNWERNIRSLHELDMHQNVQIQVFNDNPILDSINDLKNGYLASFSKKIPSSEYYRIAFSFPEKVMFLDIETTGLSKVYSYITVIGWYINKEYKYVLYGNPLDEFINDLKNCEVIVTFNGSLFDLPFINYQYEGLKDIFASKCHIDLRFFSKRYGYTGGQKSIENQLCFKRPKDLECADGKEAISWWYQFLSGNNNSLKKLLYYNCYDILGMVFILNFLFFHEIYGRQFPKFGNPVKFNRQYYKRYTELNDDMIQHAKEAVAKNITFFKHSQLRDAYNDIVVGIDLTGSESKASGVALICGNNVKTALIYSDDELIDYIVENKCDLVSIDSPLSIPEGRNSVFDDDPARETAGIMRYCERILKKRGVNVYPALIPSMQRLTQRGIRIADRLRKLGVPVIESFPGAAQDVLQIPRKRTDLYYLKRGLIEFGISGNFIHQKVSHDELDAITSALVGQFYIANYYEALGKEEENYLIIPSTQKNKNRRSQKVIGVCGPIATGKTLFSREIETLGYHYIRYSQVIAEYIASFDSPLEPTRENLQKWGNIIFKDYGQYWLNKKLFDIIKNSEHIVIDGLRHPEDVAFLRERFYGVFKCVYIDSDLEIRKKRYALKSKVNYEDVLKHEVEQHIDYLKELSDCVVLNNNSKEDLFQLIDGIIE